MKKVTKKESKRKADPRLSRKSGIWKHSPKYDVILELENAPSGLNFGHLLREDAFAAKMDIDRLFFGKLAKNMSMAGTSREDNGRLVLKVATLAVYGSRVEALMDSWAIPNFISLALAERLTFKPDSTTRSITVATVERSNVVGILRDVPVSFYTLEQPNGFPISQRYPFDKLVGENAM